MGSSFTLQDVPERLRAQYAAMPPHLQATALAMLARTRDARQQRERERKIVLPAAPMIDERDLVMSVLSRSCDEMVDGATALHQRREIDAQLGIPHQDRDMYPHAHNQQVKMLTLSEAAAILDISESAVRRLIRGRGLPSVRFYRTVRVRSDHVWAVRNRMAAGHPLSSRELVRHRRGEVYRGVPLEEVAATLRVHPHTAWRWWRRYANNAEPDAPVTDLPWRVVGRRDSALVPEDVLAAWEVPYNPASLQLIRFTDVHRLSARERRLIGEVHRRENVRPNQVRRTDKVRDAVSRTRLYTMAEAALMMNMTASGVRKAIERAGISTSMLCGQRRVRHDDLFQLINQRSRKINQRLRPWFTPDYGDDPAMVPLAEAAERIGVTVRTLRRRGAVGKIELVTSDGQLFMRRHEVHAAIADSAQRAHRSDERRTPSSASLSQAHVDSFVAWARWRYPDMDPAAALYTRARAAAHAGCRPSVIDALVHEGLIPARRAGRDFQIRLVDLIAAGVFSAKVARMCPRLQVSDPQRRRSIEAEFLTFDQAARPLQRPASEVRYLARIGTLNAVRFGAGAHRLHESEVFGPARARFDEQARPYSMYTPMRHMGFGHTVNDAAALIGVSERTVLRMISRGALQAVDATKLKWRRGESGILMKQPVRVNHGGLLVSDRSVAAARRLRQMRGELPKDDVPITVEHVRGGTGPQLQPWQRYMLVDDRGNRLDEYGREVAG
ncbi:helix-turn-helix domain-containing protein [Mycolicibacterium aubagnense]|uniref:Helix-turn-helix domain-containing protein n=1 Tax=Mycolicibacterium aubagnense TaxID=319707 RepID=A0ABN5Z1B3_9MYCO|nr:helix-turn-helix domain-containing protein [Mycolicibacterium aubagnense]TLH64301.1 DNA-binding protein [Mycolicibacterium aubagnense]BBX87957.1 hypothetical protein MAUB_58300 [Mycolicibacterium aubagnense]